VERVDEIIRRYNLEEDPEYVIIPITAENGHKKRCFILKRRFIRIAHPGGHFVDYPLEEVIEAIIKHPDLLLSESIRLVHKEPDVKSDEHPDGQPL
jgi:hypothetical protein